MFLKAGVFNRQQSSDYLIGNLVDREWLTVLKLKHANLLSTDIENACTSGEATKRRQLNWHLFMGIQNAPRLGRCTHNGGGNEQ